MNKIVDARIDFPNHSKQACLLLLAMLGSLLPMYAQTEPMYSQYVFNTLPLNPAYAGSHEHLSVTSASRVQWTKMEAAPFTQTLSAHSPVKDKNIALGLSAVHDKTGVTGKTGLYGVYAYRIRLKGGSKLSLGLQAGLVRRVSRYSRLSTRLPDDPVTAGDEVWHARPGFGAGVYWYSAKWYAGFSVPDLYEVKRRSESAYIRDHRHFFFHAGHIYPLTYSVKHMPSLLVKGVAGSRLQFDINNFFIFNEVLWLGISYRSATSLNFIVQAQVSQQLSLGYAYDVPLSLFSRRAGPSHEFKVSYRFVFVEDNAYMPRYF